MFDPFYKIKGGNHNTKNHMIFNTDISHATSQIVIEDGVWVGSEVTILSKSHIREGSIIAAKSLVNSYVPPYSVAMGLPVKKNLKRFNSKEELIELLQNVNSKYTFEDLNKIYSKYKIKYTD